MKCYATKDEPVRSFALTLKAHLPKPKESAMLVFSRENPAGMGGIMKKTIITVVGKDTVGIIAKVCTYLADNNINILDISQTIVQGYFNMMMIVDTADMTKCFGEMADELEALGQKIGVAIKCQKEEIFDRMHRI